MNFQEVLTKYRQISFSERDKGDRFERLIQAFLKTYPVYDGKFKHIWQWKEFPYKQNIGGKDTGIDLVTQTVEGDFWAIQCKCWDQKSTIDKPSVDSFLATSSKTFINDQHQTDSFALRLWISTTNRWGSEAENAIQHQNPPVHRINLTDLEDAPVAWEELDKGIFGAQARQEKKKLREHQRRASDTFHEHFQKNSRGKLIMACGTGKTFTSLKIAERETSGKGLVLFLVPSIALLGQTLREWTAEAEKPIFPICICSDPEVSKHKTKNGEESDGYSVENLALPASTYVPDIVKQFSSAEKTCPEGMIVVFSTYQSIEVIARAQEEFGKHFDLIICDEAHRTTGVTIKGEDDSAFVKVHDNDFIRAKKRIYMTATPRLYNDSSKEKAKESEAYLCSMDNEAMYGPEVFRIGFGEAVDKKLLSDYKVLVLTLKESQIPEALQKAIADKTKEISTDDASKLIGCINALSKRMLVDEGLLRASDPNPMHRAVAFCQSIKNSKRITNTFNEYKDDYYSSFEQNEREELVNVSADHVDGTMGATLRDAKLAWLKNASSESNECRVLTNVRCLSEGVDVPSLDAVMFLSARNSQVDVVQSVGRVMRVASGKNYGYIIIPVVIPSNVSPEEALNDNERFRVVWTVLNALRAHDDRFNAMVNKIELNKHKPKNGGSVLIGGIGGGNGSSDAGDSKPKSQKQLTLPLPEIQQLQNAIYARMVQKVGNKRYWEQWAADVAQIAQGYIERITRLVAQEGPHKEKFEEFLNGLRKNINPSVKTDEVVEMLAQHMITKPVFEALFENYSFVGNNPVSKALQSMVDLLEEQALEKDTVVLTRFYQSVKQRVSGIDNSDSRQSIMVELYEKFFKTAFPRTVEKLGIVYTPIKIVDFINKSVADVLQKEFGRSLSDENIHILDPFTGTGTFISRLIQSGLIEKSALKRKYEQEFHANEIILLAYYIASINIENTFHEAMGESSDYEPFSGICLTDTFQLGETEDVNWLYSPMLPQNSERVQEQQKAPIRVILGNPPYSAGQKSANDNAQNQEYPKLEKRIVDTYAAGSKATLKNSLYDSYIKAFRWASDRLEQTGGGGIVAFVSNAGWIDGNAMDGFRKCLENEFSAAYVFNLRGNQRTSGEVSRKEGGKIFGSGSRTPIAITVLIKNPTHEGKAIIRYRDIGDYLSREEKLDIIAQKQSILSGEMDWELLCPNEHGDWLTQRNDLFSSFIPIGDKDNKTNKHTVFINYYSHGLKTQRDAWCFNFSKKNLEKNMRVTIDFYNEQLALLQNNSVNVSDASTIIGNDPQKISWSRSLRADITNNKKKVFEINNIRISAYRPFSLCNVYYSREMNELIGLMPKIFPTLEQRNLVICVSANKNELPLIAMNIVDLHFNGDCQCFPLYYYEEKSIQHPTLFDFNNNQYTRRDGITDFILEQCRFLHGPKVTKEDIFYYVYGLLHSPDYREQFSADLKKMLPRLPLVEKTADFWAFSNAGRALAELHLKYEEQPLYPDAVVTGAEHENFRVEKMRFSTKGDKSVIEYNSRIKISNIPLATYDYVINGRSAIEWIMDRYQVKVDKASGIKNDPNDWADERGKPRYILDLLLSIITVSLETMKIVHALPALLFVEEAAKATPNVKTVAITKPHPQIFPHPGREAAIRKILPYILQARPGMAQDKAFQRAWLSTYPEACSTLLADKAQAFNDAYFQSALGQWPLAKDDPVREKGLWKSWKNNMGIIVNANAECFVTGEIKYPIQGIGALIPFILEAGDNYDLGIEQLITQEQFQGSVSSLQACYAQLTEALKAIDQAA
ncbi:MAG TPA: type ISP restriction/modification enzyme [Desulfovibrio sp.]|uniref:DEAD/DEAH box helicase n=1 Tax=Desulfovibrio sp. TaxID=885 RepID=UPI002D404187|nr:type ISP restriction/modification enzyme [Desulfovibrio sp.]HZF60973.1 type ISP restriction/modification enzyme [Desulfovibrio sp.]